MQKSPTSSRLTDEQWNGIAMLGEAITRSGVDAQELAEVLSGEMAIIGKAKALAAFLGGPAAADITASIVRVTEFMQREDIPGAARDALLTLAELHRSGTLSALRVWNEQMATAGEAMDLGGIADDTIPQLADRSAARLGSVVKAVQHAAEDADNDRDHLGGITGLLHMLRDPEVQQGMRTLMVLPGYLRRDGAEANGAP